MLGLMGEKLGMTHVYKDGKHVPVTVVSVLPNWVLDVRTQEKNGYNAVVVGAGNKKEQRIKKPTRGYLKKNKLPFVSEIKEFRTDKATEYKVGSEITCAHLEAGDKVDVRSQSKGKGFQGVMKRYNFAGGADSHGCSVSHRVPGSIGQGTWPGKVIKGKRMPGHMGSEFVTVKNLEIVAVEPEQNIVLISGSIPGPKSARLVLNLKPDFETRVLTVKEEKKDDVPAEEVQEASEENAKA